jgi:hypothetical protein
MLINETMAGYYRQNNGKNAAGKRKKIMEHLCFKAVVKTMLPVTF